jgi:hypothetical protein
MVGEVIAQIVVEVIFQGIIVEGVGGLLRVTGALLRWPFKRGMSYKQVLRAGGNGWTGLLFFIFLFSSLAWLS